MATSAIQKICILITLTTAQYVYAQVDPYKMRHAIWSASTKPQDLGSVSQRGTILSSDAVSTDFETTLTSALRSHSYWHETSLGRSSQDFYYRNQLVSANSLTVFGLYSPSLISSPTVANGLGVDFHSAYKTEVLYGQNLNNFPASETQAQLYYPLDAASYENKGFLWKGLAQIQRYDRTIGIQGFIENSKFSQRIEGSISQRLPSHILQNQFLDSAINSKYQIRYTAIWQLADFKKIFWHAESNLSDTYRAGQLYKIDSGYALSLISNNKNFALRSMIQFQNQSSDNPFYSGIQVSLGYQYDPRRQQEFIKDQTTFSALTEHSLILQANIYKNHNARHVSFGGIAIYQNLLDPISHNQMSSTINTPSAKRGIKGYYRREFRPSSDVSWNAGIHGSYELVSLGDHGNPSLRGLPSLMATTSWSRHLCESSNYSVAITAEHRAPSSTELYPLGNSAAIEAHLDLKPENKLLIEANFYRKINDFVEIDATGYLRFMQNAIVQKEHYNGTIMPNKYSLRYENIDKNHSTGGDASITYHISRSILTYASCHFNTILSPLDSLAFPVSLPLYGKFGIKIKTKKMAIHTYGSYQMATIVPRTNMHRYSIQYGVNSSEGRRMEGFLVYSIGVSFELHPRIKLILKGENLLDSFYISYLSLIPNLGRNIGAEIRCVF